VRFGIDRRTRQESQNPHPVVQRHHTAPCCFTKSVGSLSPLPPVLAPPWFQTIPSRAIGGDRCRREHIEERAVFTGPLRDGVASVSLAVLTSMPRFVVARASPRETTGGGLLPLSQCMHKGLSLREIMTTHLLFACITV
jgi:hypothetical protein